MVVCYQVFFESENSVDMRAENELLKNHNPVLEQEISDVEQNLKQLKRIDEKLNDRLFNTTSEKGTVMATTLNKQKVLLAGVGDFQTIIDFVHLRSTQLIEKSLRANAAFSANFNVAKDQVENSQYIPTLLPVKDARPNALVSGYGERINPFHKGKYNHPGVDFAAPRGSSVLSSAPGTVIRTSRTSLQAGYGNYIVIDHGNGFLTRYAHLEAIKVKKGARIEKGDIIGFVGSSGGSVAPHLHYEVIRNGEHVDPGHYLLEGLTSDEYGELLERASEANQSLD